MDSCKLGLYTLGIYVLMSIASWSIAEVLSEIHTLIMFTSIFIISVILWYEAIRKGVTKSIKDGIIVSLFFIVPYGIMTLTTYKAFFRDELRDAFKLVIWTVFSNPVRVVNEEISFMKSVDFFVLQPLLLIGLLLLINIVLHLFRSRNKNI